MAQRSKLSRTITRGRLAAGSMVALSTALGKPRLSYRTMQEWEQERRVPADYVAAAVLERIETYLSGL